MTVNVHLGDEQGLDRSRRYLRPVARLQLPDEPDLVHVAVYEWLPMFEAWATGPAICGRSTTQGPLPDGTEATCSACLAYQPKYQMMMQPTQTPLAQNALSQQVRAAVKESGLKQAWIAERLGITQKYLSQLLTGHAPISLEWAEKILPLCGKRIRIVIEEAA
ncbi:helix-turn-helix domain-containing protein [Streptomyces sp. BA2]|uniref:helix-turn-helix domain-containing protein n=1 Tax=Streptomyces sp. BA2 TaxID=436595 RepID=UPI00132C6AD7|nr:helix-turn-helix transcriptional regulator [Streptomyces sp. BA2]MWA08712.1 helix-turn-helix domain-containing protein [Streptomyces sp. BA2]